MSTNLITVAGKLDMLHSLYDFKATYAKTLSFKNNEYFILNQSNTKHKNWWEVINEKGEIGFIPSNYVETVTVNPTFYLKFIDTVLENLKKIPEEPAKVELDARLRALRPQVEFLNGRVSPPSRFKNSETKSQATSKSSLLKEIREEVVPKNGSRRNSVIVDEEPITPSRSLSKENIRKSIESIHDEVKSDIGKNREESPSITQQSVYELVESVRINTHLSHDRSRLAVSTVVEGLHELLPASVFAHLSTILSHVQSTLVDNVQIDQTHDASRLRIIFKDLATRTEDSQQRSWTVHEDEQIIKDNLSELISILSNADISISKHVISSDQYHFIITLIRYYQMEVRWSIRQLLLQTFGVLCGLDKIVVNIMLNSILPGELARDMMANYRNIPKLHYSSILLTMIFSMAEPMPITHREILNKDFALFMINQIEEPLDIDVEEQLPDLFLNCVISFNLQFQDYDDNPILNALEERELAKTFTEKILILLNREHDPVRIFEHEPAPPHSLIKLFIDLFSRRTTADLFYTNDIRVLIDIVARNISDLSPGDKRRGQYIELCRRTMRNTNYDEHRHRNDEILKAFTRILCEDNELSRNDQNLVREISHEFPQFFK